MRLFMIIIPKDFRDYPKPRELYHSLKIGDI